MNTHRVRNVRCAEGQAPLVVCEPEVLASTVAFRKTERLPLVAIQLRVLFIGEKISLQPVGGTAVVNGASTANESRPEDVPGHRKEVGQWHSKGESLSVGKVSSEFYPLTAGYVPLSAG